MFGAYKSAIFSHDGSSPAMVGLGTPIESRMDPLSPIEVLRFGGYFGRDIYLQTWDRVAFIAHEELCYT